jgi:hypothetical protein
MSAPQSAVVQKATENSNGSRTQKLPGTATPRAAAHRTAPRTAAPQKAAPQTSDGTAQKKGKQTAIIISVFACCGNTSFKKNCKDYGYTVVDLDSEKYGWKKDDKGQFIFEIKKDNKGQLIKKKVRSETWDTMYLKAIEAEARKPENKNTIILVSTHSQTREGLPARDLKFSVVHPESGLKKEWLGRMEESKSTSGMVDIFTESWGKYIRECANTTHAEKCHTLGPGQYLFDIVHDIVDGFPKLSTGKPSTN